MDFELIRKILSVLMIGGSMTIQLFWPEKRNKALWLLPIGVLAGI